MRRFDARIIWGLLLIVGGALYLLQDLGILKGALNFLWAFLLGAAGLAFLFTFLTNRVHWWALIPGLTLLSVGTLIALDQIRPRFSNAWGGTLVLGGIGVSFLAIYLADRRQWWAIIPGGVLATLAAVARLDAVEAPFETGGVFFLGLGLTFGLVALLPTPRGRMRWAFIPAGILLVMGLLILAAAEKLLNYLWPAALILAGLYLVWRAFRPRPSG